MAFALPERTRSLSARPPSASPMASVRRDLPAPVSPVRTVKPDSKLSSAYSMVAILVTVRARSTGCLDSETDEGVGVEAGGVEFGSGEFGARGGAPRLWAQGEGVARAGCQTRLGRIMRGWRK